MGATNPVGSWVPTNNTTQTGAAYKNQIDADFAVAQRIVDAYAPRPAATPNMTVIVDAGNLFVNGTLTEVAQQTTPTFSAPVGNPRIDRVCINATTGALTVVAGTPAASPVAPAIPSGYFPCAQVLLTTSTTAIGASNIYDERPYGGVAASAGPALLLSGNAISVAALTLNLSAFISLYSSFTVVLTNLAPITNNTNLRAFFLGCATHQWSASSVTSGGGTATNNNNSDTGATAMFGVSNAGGESVGFLRAELMFAVATDGSRWSKMMFNSTYLSASSVERNDRGSANGVGATTGVQFGMTSGNFTCTYRVYGNP